jgi:PAS domain S-box-containing protein
MNLSIEKQFFIRTLLIVGIILISGIISFSVISEEVKNNELKLIGKIHSTLILHEITNAFQLEDFHQISDNSSEHFSTFFKDYKSDGFLRATVWNMSGDVLFSTSKNRTNQNISETLNFKKVVLGEVITELKNLDLEETPLNRSHKEIEITTNISLDGNVVGVMEYDVDPTTIINNMDKINQTLFLIIACVTIMTSGVFIIDFIISRKKLLKGLTTSANKIIQHELDLFNIRKALDESSTISITDYKGTITYVNKKFEELSKYSAKELIGQTHRMLKSGYHTPEFYAKMWGIISEGFIWRGEIKNKAKDGSFYWIETTIIPLVGRTKSENQYISVRIDITKLKETEIRLFNALEQLKGDDKLKDEFASMVSHELKSPLTPITGYCDMLLEPDFLGSLNKEQTESICIIKANSQRLEKLIGDVLDAQKLQLNHMTFTKKDFNIETFMTTLKNDLSIFMKEKNVELVIQNNFDGIINCDASRLRQVMDNLAKNSVDFVPQVGGKISIGVLQDDADYLFYVRDNGIGISLENQNNIFKKFYQVNTSATRKHGGTGLGLVVCKGIVEGLGGKIWVESHEGIGTIFYFTIPKITILC